MSCLHLCLQKENQVCAVHVSLFKSIHQDHNEIMAMQDSILHKSLLLVAMGIEHDTQKRSK